MFSPIIHIFLTLGIPPVVSSFQFHQFHFCVLLAKGKCSRNDKDYIDWYHLIPQTIQLISENALNVLNLYLSEDCLQQDCLPASLASLSFQIEQLIKRSGIWSDVQRGGGGRVNICYFLVCSQITTCWQMIEWRINMLKI